MASEIRDQNLLRRHREQGILVGRKIETFRKEETVLYDRFEVTKYEMFFGKIDGRETTNYSPPSEMN